MHRMRPPNGRRPGLADAEKAHLALADELAHRADRVLDRNGGIDPMDVIEIDNVGPEPPEALLAGFVHIFRPAVREARVAEQPEIAKLTRDDVIAAVPSDRLGYELLVAGRGRSRRRYREDRRRSRAPAGSSRSPRRGRARRRMGSSCRSRDRRPKPPTAQAGDAPCCASEQVSSRWAGIRAFPGSGRSKGTAADPLSRSAASALSSRTAIDV